MRPSSSKGFCLGGSWLPVPNVGRHLQLHGDWYAALLLVGADVTIRCASEKGLVAEGVRIAVGTDRSAAVTPSDQATTAHTRWRDQTSEDARLT